MSRSLVMYFDRSGGVNVIDPDEVRHSPGLDPVLRIAAALKQAGYEGVAIDSLPLSDGRCIYAIAVVSDSAEGQIIQYLEGRRAAGMPLPPPAAVVEKVASYYRERKGGSRHD